MVVWLPSLLAQTPDGDGAGTITGEAGGSGLLGGPELMVLIVLALGAAMVVGNVMALLRPPERTPEGDLQRAPVLRSAVMVGVGALAAIWAIASLIT